MSDVCSICKGRGYVWLGSQPYGMAGESYAPCSCPAGVVWLAERKAMLARIIQQPEGQVQ